MTTLNICSIHLFINHSKGSNVEKVSRLHYHTRYASRISGYGYRCQYSTKEIPAQVRLVMHRLVSGDITIIASNGNVIHHWDTSRPRSASLFLKPTANSSNSSRGLDS